MNLPTIHPISNDAVERKSSIFQHNNLLAVMQRGEWCPLVFDIIDGVECRQMKSHKVVLRLRPGLNYTFPVGTCRYAKNTYYTTQKDKIETRVLPSYYGAGFYQAHERKNMFTNIGDQAFGVRQEKILRVGKDYVQAQKTLKAVE